MDGWIPYGHTQLPFAFPANSNGTVLHSRIGELKSEKEESEIVLEAMRKPIASPRLEEIAKDRKKAVIIISDHTRPVPSKVIVPYMLEELRRANPDIEIVLLVATGFHRGTTKKELIEKLGADIVQSEKIVVHDAQDQDSNVRIGVLPSGAELIIDKVAVDCDLLVSEGFVEPHFFAGFSGGRKSVLPGICDQKTVFGNHCGAFIDSPYARTGILDHNPIHADMLAAQEMAGLAYIVNVVINEEKKVVASFAGDPVKAHEAACRFLAPYCEIEAEAADIVITGNGGAPLDQNIYQCVKSMTAAEACVRPGGVIILCAECADGTGGESFYRKVRDCASPEALYEEAKKTPYEQTIADQWQYQILARILMKNHVLFVTEPKLRGIIEEMKMEYASSLEEALNKAVQMAGKENPSITAIPNGISVIVHPKTII